MCLVVDNDVAALVLLDPRHPQFGGMYEYLHRKNAQFAGCGKLVFGGELANEYPREVVHEVAKLYSKGVARKEDDAKVDREATNLRGKGLCKSNDPHVVALGRVSGARLLCTHDCRLMDDWKKLAGKPGGRIYNRRDHNGLIRRLCICRNCKARPRTCGAK